MKELPDGNVDLVDEVGWMGNVLVSLVWDDAADLDARKGPVLKADAAEKAKKLEFPRVVESGPEKHDEENKKSFLDKFKLDKGKNTSGAAKEAKLKNLLGLGKKK